MNQLINNNPHIYWITDNDILSADKLADFKKLRGGVYFVDSLPMTASGKFLKSIVKEMAIKSYNNEKNV